MKNFIKPEAKGLSIPFIVPVGGYCDTLLDKKGIISLCSMGGTIYNNKVYSKLTYKITHPVIGGWASIRIKTNKFVYSIPVVVNATLIAGATFTPGIEMLMIVQCIGDKIQYFFLDI